MVGVGSGAIGADTGVEWYVNVGDLLSNKHLTISLQAERQLHTKEWS